MKTNNLVFTLSIPLLVILGTAPIAQGAPSAPASSPAPAAQAAPPGAGRSAQEYLVAGKREAIPSPIGLNHYLAVSALVFGLGIAVIVVRRNAIAILMGIELILNAAGLNFVAFSKYVAKDVIDGQILTIFLIVIAAGEAAVALAIILNIYNNLNTVTVDEADELKG